MKWTKANGKPLPDNVESICVRYKGELDIIRQHNRVWIWVGYHGAEVTQKQWDGLEWLDESPEENTEEEDAVAFGEWIKNSDFVVVSSVELGREAWVNCKENEVLVNGSDWHFTELINKCSLSTRELYPLFKSK